MSDKNKVIHNAIRPGTILDGMNTDEAEAILNIKLGIKVCNKWQKK